MHPFRGFAETGKRIQFAEGKSHAIISGLADTSFHSSDRKNRCHLPATGSHNVKQDSRMGKSLWRVWQAIS
jgi:hypothetical protein